MSEPTNVKPILDYSTPQRPEPSMSHFKMTMYASATSAGVAVMLLLSYAITRFELFAFFGLLWLLLGGILTLGAFISGMIYAWTAYVAGFGTPHTQRLAWLAVCLPLSNVLPATACIRVGGWLFSYFNPGFMSDD